MRSGHLYRAASLLDAAARQARHDGNDLRDRVRERKAAGGVTTALERAIVEVDDDADAAVHGARQLRRDADALAETEGGEA